MSDPFKTVRNVVVQLLIVIAMATVVLQTHMLDFIFHPGEDKNLRVTLAPDTPMNRRFDLIDQRGRWVADSDYNDKPWVVFFGYTHCPDVCPVTLSRLGALWGQLPDPGALHMLFITVDPARDTPEVMQQYMKAFDPRFVALSGPQDKIDAVVKNFNVFVEKKPQPGTDGYGVNHTAAVFLIRENGTLAGTISPEETDDIALGKLKRLAEKK
ncbi:MAG TPA: SCO family protein [Alphaproteobacteria bacterium]|nr:SCO family protein [Alphaproteobacteria bacterium]